jgi:predicted nucleotidyltransferase component of viral defense system
VFESAVDTRVLRLLREAFADAGIAARFYLAGGTALALHRGHRRSEDIDLFSRESFNETDFEEFIIKRRGTMLKLEAGTVHGVVDEVRISFLYYPYACVSPLLRWENIELAGIPDIAAMKAAAISRRGEKKDFFDIFELLKALSPEEVKRAYVAKYGPDRTNCYHTLRSMFYFDDAESSPDPVSLNGTTWAQVKESFRRMEGELTRALLC